MTYYFLTDARPLLFGTLYDTKLKMNPRSFVHLLRIKINREALCMGAVGGGRESGSRSESKGRGDKIGLPQQNFAF